MKSALIEKLQGMLEDTDISVVATKIRTIQSEYEQLYQKGLDKARQEFIEGGGNGREFVFTKSSEDEKITALLDKFRELKKDADLKISNDQRKNLESKKEIIKEINDLIQLSQTVGAALKKLTDLQAKWKAVGSVSPHEYKNLQADYSKTVENFNYNLKIYRELQEHDLKKNHELKSEILEKLKRLSSNEKIKDVERLAKIFRNEWEEVGPVQNDKWEELKSTYKETIDTIYSRIKLHYKSREEESNTNLDFKKEITSQVVEISSGEYTTEEQWQKKTEEIIALQAKWKETGKTEQKKGDIAWNQFRTVCDSFFEKKKLFYGGLKEVHGEVRKNKLALIEGAVEISTSTDWKNATEKLIQLQNRWKKLPQITANEEHRLFFKFRKACNTFFDAKRTHYDAIDNQYAGNLVLKEAILEKVNSYVMTTDAAQDKIAMKTFSEEWNAAGLVPFKEKKRINEAFFQKMDEMFEKLNISTEEKGIVRFLNKVERLAGSEGGYDLLVREYDHFRKIAEEINSTIITFENNMGFFKFAKTKNQMMIDLEEKIALEKGKLGEIKKKQKTLNETMRKMRELNPSLAPTEIVVPEPEKKKPHQHHKKKH